MRQNIWKTTTSPSLNLKYGTILLLILLGVVVVACGGGATNANLGQPNVTVTINLGQSDGSPTPHLPGNTSSAWSTNTQLGSNISPTSGVYPKLATNVI